MTYDLKYLPKCQQVLFKEKTSIDLEYNNTLGCSCLRNAIIVPSYAPLERKSGGIFSENGFFQKSSAWHEGDDDFGNAFAESMSIKSSIVRLDLLKIIKKIENK